MTGTRGHGFLSGLLLIVAASLAGSCGAPAADPTDPAVESVELRVFAAASLTGVMADLEAAYEASTPGVDVVVNLAGSSTLRAQILDGAPADVVATANPEVMDDLVEAGLVIGQPLPFASNRLVIAVAPGNPGGVAGLDDLARPDLFLGLCARGVPCGDLADTALAEAGLTIEPDTREPDVRALLTKVRSGELDAGLVYATDVAATSADGVQGLALPPGLATETTYPVAVLTEATTPEEGQRFARYLTGAEGAAILADHGFGTP